MASFISDTMLDFKTFLLKGIEMDKVSEEGEYTPCIVYVDESFQTLLWSDGTSVEASSLTDMNVSKDKHGRIVIQYQTYTVKFQLSSGQVYGTDSILTMLEQLKAKSSLTTNLTSTSAKFGGGDSKEDKELNDFNVLLEKGLSVQKCIDSDTIEKRVLKMNSNFMFCSKKKNSTNNIEEFRLKTLKVFKNPLISSRLFFVKQGDTKMLLELEFPQQKLRDYMVNMLSVLIEWKTQSTFQLPPRTPYPNPTSSSTSTSSSSSTAAAVVEGSLFSGSSSTIVNATEVHEVSPEIPVLVATATVVESSSNSLPLVTAVVVGQSHGGVTK